MKIVLTGSNGHISGPLAQQLAKAGHHVSLITSKADKTAAISALGAQPLVGSVQDVDFLAQSFTGADLVYLMIPPVWGPSNWQAHLQSVADALFESVTRSGVQNVVILSSIGAHMKKGCGPVDGVAYLEGLFADTQLNVLALRPSYFYYNLFSMAGMVKHAGIIGSAQPASHNLVLTATEDIAAVAFEEIHNWNRKGFSVRYIASDQRTWAEVAAVLGTAIGKPELPYVEFTDEQSEAGMLQAGVPPTNVVEYVAMGQAIRSGEMESDFKANPPAVWGKVKLEDFAKAFAAAYQNA
jgi:uncharacterized protein YbjT (DUF2867 family)